MACHDLFRLLGAVNRRQQRIDYALDESMRQAEGEEAGKQHGRAKVIEERHDGPVGMRRENDEQHARDEPRGRQGVQRAHANDIHEIAADENGERERKKCGAEHQAHLLVGNVKRRAHGAGHVAADGEHHRGRANRDAARDEQPLLVHGLSTRSVRLPGWTQIVAQGTCDETVHPAAASWCILDG